ncbi:MAG: FAD-binding oxidoreductase [Deltaproteobacteria bacterium]|nr:FAD-binding oxidoreductase [Deltaproteobacteria bacterium]
MSLTKITTISADRVTEDDIERKLYSRDLAFVPSIMVKPFFQTLPDAVIRPGNAEQVADVLRQATNERIPVTPRAAASTSYYNSVPVRGGWVLDMNDLRDGIELDTAQQTVRVLPATTWFDLDDALQQKGFAVKSYPSSAVSATVGGWVSMQGQGIGSLKYGGLGEQLVSLQVALPSERGELRTITRKSDPPLDWFVATEGTLGVITRVELTVRPRPVADSHHLFAFDDLSILGQSVGSLARAEPRPFTIFFADSGYLRLLERAGFDIPLDLPQSTFPVSEKGLLLVSFQGEPSEVTLGRDRLLRVGGNELSSDLALDEWNLRLHHLRTKRAGPSLLAAEVWLPLNDLSHYLTSVKILAERSHLLIGTYGFAVAPDMALVMSLYPTDERRTVKYLAAIGFTKRLHDLAARYGGRPYGVGLWNTAYLPRLFSRTQLSELKRRKALLDPSGIMNPGKLYQASFPLWPITFVPGATILGAAHVALGKDRS